MNVFRFNLLETTIVPRFGVLLIWILGILIVLLLLYIIYLYLKRVKGQHESKTIQEEPTPVIATTVAKPTVKKQRTIFNYSFRSRIHLAPKEALDRYEDLRTALLKYEDVKANETWKYERYTYHGHSIVKVKLQGKTMRLFFGLDPKTITDKKYRIVDQSNVKMHENTPTMLVVKGPRGLKHAIELIDMWVDKHHVKEKATYTHERLKFKALDKIALIRKGLIKTNDAEFLERLEQEEVLKNA